MNGKVIKKQSSLFFVDSKNIIYKCSARGNLKKYGILTGDNVEFDKNTLSIEKILPRKNKLIRPPLANLDQLIILLSSEPSPDFLLIDKLILFCKVNGITPILCHSKMDLDTNCTDYIKKVYGEFIQILEISSLQKTGLDSLKKVLNNKISAFAGQSGVGKSALINALFGEVFAEVGSLSEKISRGKNTTRHTELFKLENGGLIADTAGFSSLDEQYLPISKQELPYYYPDFLKFLPNCKYKSCTHINEPNCAVKIALDNGKLDIDRYNRYLAIFSNLKG